MKLFGAMGTAVLFFALCWFWFVYQGTSEVIPSDNSNTIHNTLTTSTGIGFRFSPSRYAIAQKPEEVSVKSYIPPCESGFEYCIYRVDETYKGTNFESAGLSVKTRTDLTLRDACLTQAPQGYEDLEAKVRNASTYATSVFAPLGDAGAGHYSLGALYRAFVGETCFEFETRIGEAQFANYPEGSIRQFTNDDRDTVYAELVEILNTALPDGFTAPIIFPSLESGPLPMGES